MARLKDESQHADCTEILSPQPFHPQSKGFLVSSLEPNEPNQRDNQMSTQDYEYNSSSSSARHSTSDVFGREMDDELEQLKSRASSRSSLSSIPASVLIHPVDRMKQMPDMDIHEKIAGYRVEQSEASFGDFNEIPTTIHTIRQREAAFRKPSSVRAMQMHTEDEADDDDYLTPRRRMRSPGSSPLKRSPYYSPTQKPPKQKKEAPLVLLHCTLLPPSIPVPGAADPRNQDILEDELPMEYWKRWRRLQDRVGSGVVRDRGVLISHPEDLYDMLEERLLESLELQRPRLQNGHFVGREEAVSGDDLSDLEESETDGEQGDECPDCGGHVRHGDSNRKWEIRVFAANGLMRAGAWAAAWRDMEKVDVEVGLWLPSDVRRGLERRFAEEQMAVVERDQASPQMQMMRMSSLVDGKNLILPEGLQSPRQGLARMVSDVGSFRSDREPLRQSFSGPPIDHHEIPSTEEKGGHEVALSTLFANYIRVLAADRRNMALVLLSILVAFLSFGYSQQKSLSADVRPFQGVSYDTAGPAIVPSVSIASPPSISQPPLEFVAVPEEVGSQSSPAEAEVPDAGSVDNSDEPAVEIFDSEDPVDAAVSSEALEHEHAEQPESDIAEESSPESLPTDPERTHTESEQWVEPLESTAFETRSSVVEEPSFPSDVLEAPDLPQGPLETPLVPAEADTLSESPDEAEETKYKDDHDNEEEEEEEEETEDETEQEYEDGQET